MRIINITPLLCDHQSELIADLLQLEQHCGITDVAFMLPLHPEESYPTMAKAEYLCGLFLQARELLYGSGLKVGILLQSLIGHGVPTDAKFQHSVNSNGLMTNSMCPLDHEFQEYVRQVVTMAAAAKPDFLLVDDDFRLANLGGTGCFCPLHLAAFNRAADNNYDRSGLIAALQKDRTGQLQRQWDEVRGESLHRLAQVIRNAIDIIDPALPCGLCVGYAEGSELQFVKRNVYILAGNQPPFVRIGNSLYQESNSAGLLKRVYWTAAQMAVLKEFPEILSESDTYPHNRYCTPTKAINCQIIYSLLNGTTGAKLWLTRMEEYEPDSSLAYRETMMRNIALYRQLRELYPAITWDEPVTPLPSPIPLPETGVWENNWACRICAHMGIPVRVGNGKTASVVMLAGQEADYFSDLELQDFLSRGVLLDSGAAEKICQRGFSELLGIDASCPPDWKVSWERLNNHAINGIAAGKKVSLTSFADISVRKIVVKDNNVQVLSDICHVPWYNSPNGKVIGAGLTIFENKLGGRVAVFAAAIGFMEYMNEIRREQLINVLDWLNRTSLPVTVDSDIDIYVRHGMIARKQDGGELLAVFNLNMDALPELRLRVGKTPIKTVSQLRGDGTWQELSWNSLSATKITVSIPVESIHPLILRIWRQL